MHSPVVSPSPQLVRHGSQPPWRIPPLNFIVLSSTAHWSSFSRCSLSMRRMAFMSLGRWVDILFSCVPPILQRLYYMMTVRANIITSVCAFHLHNFPVIPQISSITMFSSGDQWRITYWGGCSRLLCSSLLLIFVIVIHSNGGDQVPIVNPYQGLVLFSPQCSDSVRIPSG